MQECLESLKHMDILDAGMTITSSLREEHLSEMDALADALAASVEQ
jgi:hypothetical protein